MPGPVVLFIRPDCGILALWSRNEEERMIGTTRPQRPQSSLRGLSLFWVLALTAAMGAAGAPAGGQGALVRMDEPTAEISHHTPMPYAIVLQEPGQIRRLYASGGVVFHPQEQSRSLTVQRIEDGALVVREYPGGPSRTVQAGHQIPRFPGLIFARMVLLDQLRYQFRVVPRIEQADPVLLSLEGSRALLEVQVLHPVSVPSNERLHSDRVPLPPGRRPQLDLALLQKVRVNQIDANTYELNASDLAPVYENASELLSDLWARVPPPLLLETGVSLRITSPLGDAILDQGSFMVTNMRVAQFLGIEVGDAITRINGRPVTRLLDLYMAVQEILLGDPRNSEVRFDITRGGLRIAKFFRVR